MTATERESLTESQWLKPTGEHHTQAIESWPDGFRRHHKEPQVEPESGLGTQQNKIHWNSSPLWARLSFCLQQLSKCPGWGWQARPLSCPLGYVLSLHRTWSPPYPLVTTWAELDSVCPRNRGWNWQPTGLPWPPDQNQTQNPHDRLGLLYVSSKRSLPGTTAASLQCLHVGTLSVFICPVHCYTLTVENSSRHRRHLLNKWINCLN